jgi:dTDP-4-dehydrorhamnose reductase
MKILIFGGSGQLGHELIKRGFDLNFELVSPVQSEVDVTNPAQVLSFTKRIKPSVVINCAAYTAVDKAESEREEAFHINCEGAKNVAIAAAKTNARVIYISTDYVFPGEVRRPLLETDAPHPINVYGESKLAGELVTLDQAGGKALIVRTSSLFGKKGINFVATMIRLFQTQKVVKVVSDQQMCPTWAGWLAEVLLDLVRINTTGIVHASCKGAISWYDFASAILESIQPHVPEARAVLEAVTTSEFARPAKRPVYSALDGTKLAGLIGRPAMTWEEGLRSYLIDIEIMDSTK